MHKSAERLDGVSRKLVMRGECFVFTYSAEELAAPTLLGIPRQHRPVVQDMCGL
jgi:hypothetical protein